MWFNRYALEDYINWKLENAFEPSSWNIENALEPSSWNIENAFEPSQYWLIVITVLQPLDPRLKIWLQENESKIEELTFVEMNHTWLLQKLISNECNLKSDSREKKLKNIRKIELYPIFKEDIPHPTSP
jgi:hypothetical protein